jgi:membrane protease YdiL (CAAX protease family)
MENETTSSNPAASARLQFHLALLTVFLPLMWPVVAGLALISRKPGPPSPEQRTWKRRLWALMAVDVLVLACFGWIAAHQERFERPSREPDRPRIGVAWDPDPARTEPRIRTVLPGSPAEKAGFQVGDLVEKIDGTPVADKTDATEKIRSGEAGVIRTIRVRRDDAVLDLAVAAELPPREQRRLFEPQPSTPPMDWRAASLSFVPPLAVVALAALVSRFRHRVAVVTWRGFLLAILGSFAAALAAALLFRSLQGGASRGAVLIGLFFQMATLLGLTRVATAWCGRDVPRPPDPLPPLAPVRATLLGALYLVTFMLRTMTLIWTLDQIFFNGTNTSQTPGLEVLATSSLGVWGTLLFLFVVVILGPLAEESLFRGFLVPRLAAMWGTTSSMVVSSLIFTLFHPYPGLVLPIVFVYGLVFAWARLRTGGILVPFILHMAVNGLVSAVILSR